MVVIYHKETGRIHQTLVGDVLPQGIELSSDEAFIVIYNDINPYKLHLCKLKLDEKGKPEEIEEPEIEYEGTFPLENRKIKGWKKHKIKEKI